MQVRCVCTSVFEHIFQKSVKQKVTMLRKHKIMIQTIFRMYVIAMKTAQLIRPPTLDPHARYTLCLVAPVARHPTKSIIKPRAAIADAITTNIIWSASIHSSLRWKTTSNMMTESDAPRYIVAQKIPTPMSSIIVANRVANGILVMHDLQQSPGKARNTEGH